MSPSADAPVVTRLREAGAVFIGKTNLHEFALGTTNEDSAFGPARHPLDPSTVTRRLVRRLGGVGPRGAWPMRRSARTRADRSAFRPPRAGWSGSSRRSERSPTAGIVPLSTHARPRRAPLPIGGGCGHRVRRAARRHVGADTCRQARTDSGSASCAAISPPCSIRRSLQRSSSATARLREAGVDAARTPASRTPETSRRSTCTSCWRKRPRTTRRRSKAAADDYTPNVGSGSKWDATSWPKTTCGRSADAKC